MNKTIPNLVNDKLARYNRNEQRRNVALNDCLTQNKALNLNLNIIAPEPALDHK